METPPQKPPSPVVTTLLTIAGIGFMALWGFVHVIWMYMAFMANAMANDSGSASTSQVMALIIGMFVGQVLTAIAGLPAGAAFFWRGRRRLLLLLFVILFVIGALLQAGSFYAYFHHR